MYREDREGTALTAIKTRGGLGRLAAWHLPGGPFGPASRGPPREKLKYVKRPTPLTGEVREGGERRERGTMSQRGGEGRREWNRKGAQRPLAREEGLYLLSVHYS